MIQLIDNPPKANWQELTARNEIDSNSLQQAVESIFDSVARNKDKALFEYTKQFDGVALEQFRVPQEAIDAAQVTPELKEAMQLAYSNILSFHESQKPESQKVTTISGVACWQKSLPIDKVGLYIPGGSAPLFSTVLMLGIPAKIAGCKEIILCTPPDLNGGVDPAILVACKMIGITQIYTVGGAQAIAAMTFGTESIPKVYKIFGPGNQYVTKAKEYATTKGLAIDMPAGPSELLVIADDQCDPQFVAADLLSQAEHGADSQVILLSPSKSVIEKVQEALSEQIHVLPRKETALKALDNSRAIFLPTLSECLEWSNIYAPEHLIIATESAEEVANQITNAGSVFLGNYTPESAGDYASGTNHTLPTNGFAKNYSGVNLGSFTKQITFQKIDAKGIKNIGPAVEIMAAAEGLQAHKNAVTVRLKALNNE